MKKHTCTGSCWHTNPLLTKGSRVLVPHRGRMVEGKIVRYDKGVGYGIPFVVVDVGENESVKTPIHKVEMIKRFSNNSISDKQALALTRKVIAYGKKLLLHEKSELRRKNPIEARHVQGFIKGIKEVEKYVVGSRPYIEALARAYGHLEKAKEEMKKTAA